MRPIVTDGVAWCVCWSVCHDREPAKTAELIEMPLRVATRVGPENHVLDGGPDPPRKKEKGRPIVKCRDSLSCATTAEPIQMQFGMLSPAGPRNHALNGRTHWRHLVNTTEPYVCCGDAAVDCFANSWTTLVHLVHSPLHQGPRQRLSTAAALWCVTVRYKLKLNRKRNR